MTRRSPAPALLALYVLSTGLPARADGPADNLPASVRRIPKLGISLAPEVRDELKGKLAQFGQTLDEARRKAKRKDLLPDVEICFRAVRDAVEHQEFFAP